MSTNGCIKDEVAESRASAHYSICYEKEGVGRRLRSRLESR